MSVNSYSRALDPTRLLSGNGMCVARADIAEDGKDADKVDVVLFLKVPSL